MCQLLRGLAVAVVLLVATTPNPSSGQAMAYSSPPCLQGQLPYTMGYWPCYLYYVNYPFLHQVHVDHVTQTEEELQSQENVSSMETEPENNATVTVEQGNTSVETKPEDNTTCPLEHVAELQDQLEDQARQLDFQKHQLQALTVVMEKALYLLLEMHEDEIHHAAHHAHPWKSKNTQLQILAAAVGKALNTLYETQEENDAQTGVMQEEVGELQGQMQGVQQAVLLLAAKLGHHAEHPAMTHFIHEHLEHVEDHAHPWEHHENQLHISTASMGKILHMLHEIQEENHAQTDLLQQEADQQQEQMQTPEPEPVTTPTVSTTTPVNQGDQQLGEKVEQLAIRVQTQESELGGLKFHQQQQDAQILILLQTMFEIAEENKHLEEKVEQQAMQMQSQLNQMTQQRALLHDLQHEVHSLPETVNERKQAVAFSVRFSSWTTVSVVPGGGYANVLKYNETITNIGDGYDPSTGLFTAPCDGLYAFFFSHHSSVYGWVTLGVFHGDRNIAASTVNGQGVSFDTSSGFGTVHLTKGEIVNVRLMGTSKERSLSYLELGPFSTFSGMLVSAN